MCKRILPTEIVFLWSERYVHDVRDSKGERGKGQLSPTSVLREVTQRRTT